MSHYFMDMRYLLTDLQRHCAASKCDNDDDSSMFFLNFITSLITTCINETLNSLGINNNSNNNNNMSKFESCAHHLDDDSRKETLDDDLYSLRPLYYPRITHLLRCLSMIRSCQRGSYVHDQMGKNKGALRTTYDLLALDSRELLTENIGNFCGSMLKGHSELLSFLEDKLNIGRRLDIRGHGVESIIHRNVFRNNIASGGNSRQWIHCRIPN